MIWYRILILEMWLKEIVLNFKRFFFEFNGFSKVDYGVRFGRKSWVGLDIVKVWVYCEVLIGIIVNYEFKRNMSDNVFLDWL